MDPDPLDVAGAPGVYVVDHELFGRSGALASFVVDADRPALVDTGGANTVDQVVAAMETLGVDPETVAYIVVTHLHLDHAGGAGHLARLCPNAEVVVHDRGADYLTDPDRLERLKESVSKAQGMEDPFGQPELVPESRVRRVSGGETLDLGDRTLDVYDAPGHAPHHFVCFDEADGTLYAADACGEYFDGHPIPSTPPPSFDLADSLETIDRLRPLEPARILYGHFGVGTGGTELLETYREELPEWVDRIEAGRAEHGEDPAAIAADLPEKWHSSTLERDIQGVLLSLES
jgi:glyoxylase-like metal-dependent hydrolase (beta-lactamase superfamily II)